MNRLVKCIHFQLKTMLRSSAIFIAIYFASILVLQLFLTISVSNSGSGSNSGFFIGGGIYIFIYVIANYKEMYNYLLMFGNTRKNIFLSNAIVSVMQSILFAAISVILILIGDIASRTFGFGQPGENSLISLIYNGSSLASEFIWLAAFFCMICSFSFIYGSLAYKFGNVFITVFWVSFGLSFVAVPVLAESNSGRLLVKALSMFFSIGNPNGILLAPINFVIAAILLGMASFAISRRQPQTA